MSALSQLPGNDTQRSEFLAQSFVCKARTRVQNKVGYSTLKLCSG